MSHNVEQRLKAVVREVPDFPKKGILFKDLTPVLLDPVLTYDVTRALSNLTDTAPDAVAAIESRGFWFGTLLAQALKVPFIPIRKQGKLPGNVDSITYDLEYNQATIELHKGHVQNGWSVLVHDDLLATGGTAIAAANLLEKQGASIHSFNFLVILEYLGAVSVLKEKFPTVNIDALVKYSCNTFNRSAKHT